MLPSLATPSPRSALSSRPHTRAIMSHAAEPTAAEIDALLQEDRTFPPPDEFRRQAHVSDRTLYQRAAADLEAFWAEQARTLDWIRPWDRVLEWNPPRAKWFVGGKLNVSANCLDRHIGTATRNKAALVWEGEPGDRRTLTYWDLYVEVNKFANVLKGLGVRRGDRVAIYLPMIPEAAVAMLACTRIGAIHSVVFGGFSPESLRDRINDAKCKVLITADGGYRRGQVVPLKRNADRALEETPSIEHVVVVMRRPGAGGDEAFAQMKEGRDHWWHRLMQSASMRCEPEAMDAEDVLYILYTSGTTGKPKGIVHTTGGYLVGVTYTTKLVFDLKEDDVYWCTADIGWVTGHSYIVYGPLANGATCVMYEGAPDWPEKDRFWDICERYGVTVFYTAPTAIRAFMKWGTSTPRGTRSPSAAGFSHSPGRGRRCCAPSGATTSATCPPTSRSGRGARTSTSPATAPSATTTATTGSSAASTTCSTSPATASARWRWSRRWCRTRRLPRRR